MSRDYNKVILIGRLARDPDVRFTPNKQKVARITLAVGREWKDRVTGEKKSETDFHPLQAWGNVADIFEKYTRKGDKVLIEGRLHSYDYTDKTGARKWATDVIVEQTVLLGGKAGQTAPQSTPAYNPDGQAPQAAAPDMASLRAEAGFEEDFPLDFSELSGESDADLNIPF